MSIDQPKQYKLFNSLATKNLVIIVAIPGVDLLSTNTVFTRIRYGDPHINYGDPGIVYGGLRKLDGVREIISLESSLTISQRLENEQGRASITQMSLSFIDKDEYMTKVVSPGVIIPEILGVPINVYLGYQQTSFKEDYFVIMRGRISGVDDGPGIVRLTIQDPNFNRRQDFCLSAKDTLAADIDNIVTTIPVLDNSAFHKQILGPNGSYDPAIKTYIKIDSEIMEYSATGFGTNSFTVTRGARGTVAASHNTGADVEAEIQIQDHGIDMALKLMLSGWNGPYSTGNAVYSIVRTFDGILGDQPNGIILPQNVDAVGDYGLNIGDWVTITGSGIGGNNGTFQITHFHDLFQQPNRVIFITGGTLTAEYPTSATLAFRSQYDTYPITCGTKLTNPDVDVVSHVDLKNRFLSDPENSFRFFITAQESCKTFIETEIYLPMGAYSLTKRGRLSIGLTHPPIADEGLVFLNKDNILDAQSITPSRQTNNRKFFNEVDIDYDYDDSGKAGALFRSIDTDSLNKIGVSSILPIQSRGLRSDLTSDATISKRASFLLSRYRNAATIVPVKVNWAIGSKIESGDVVALDGTDLKIANFATGTRDFGTQLFEVINRDMDIKEGSVGLQLVSGINADITDRFSTISPSSMVIDGSTSFLEIEDSFGVLFPDDEQRKWLDYVGMPIAVHSEDYSYYQTTILAGFDEVDPYKMLITGLGSLPGSFNGLIVDIIPYPDSPSKTLYSVYKAIHAFFSPEVAVTSGISHTQFNVASGDVSKFFVGCIIQVHKEDFSQTSNDIKVTDITGTTITVATDMGFTPDNTFLIDGIGFADGQGFYRWV